MVALDIIVPPTICNNRCICICVFNNGHYLPGSLAQVEEAFLGALAWCLAALLVCRSEERVLVLLDVFVVVPRDVFLDRRMGQF